MNHKEVHITVRRSGTLAFDICIKTGHVDIRTGIQKMLDKALEPNTAFRLFDWAESMADEPYPGQNFQKEFIYLAIRTFCGEPKEAYKILNTWVNAVEKQVGKNNLTIEFDRLCVNTTLQNLVPGKPVLR